MDLNNTDPDQESSNAESVLAALDGESELGVTGPEAADTAPTAMLDAIVGSYPELANQAEIIHGTDDRVRVGNTTVYRWRAICALRITATDNRRFIGTGWLISPRTC